METDFSNDAAQLFKLALEAPEMFIGAGPNKKHALDSLQAYRSAPVVRFDYDTSHMVARLSLDWFDVLARLLPIIRLPYDRCIISLNNYGVEKGLLAYGARDRPLTHELSPCRSFLARQTSDTVAEFKNIFTAEGKIWLPPVHMKFDAEPGKEILPWNDERTDLIHMDFHTSLAKDFLTRFRHGEPDVEHKSSIILWMLGSVLRRDQTALDGAHREFLRHVGILPTVDRSKPWAVPTALQTGVLDAIYSETIGDMRMVLSALALLSLRVHQTVQLGAGIRKLGRMRYKARTTPYLVEHAVTLVLPERRLRSVLAVQAKLVERHHRRHSVRGHWVQRGGDRRCVHILERHDANHFECSRCGTKQFFRREHERGDASLGYVTRAGINVEAREGEKR